MAEYTVVAVLAALLAAPSGTLDQPAADQPASGQARAQAAPGDDQPPVVQAVTKVLRAGAALIRGVTGAARWLIDLWRRADQQATAKGEAMAAPPPSPSALSTWRFRS